MTVDGCTIRSPAKLNQGHATGSRIFKRVDLYLYSTLGLRGLLQGELYLYLYIYINLFNSYVALKWDSKHFKNIFEMTRIQISAHRSLLMRVQVFFTPWGKCRDTGIIRNCNVTDSFHSFFQFTRCAGA